MVLKAGTGDWGGAPQEKVVSGRKAIIFLVPVPQTKVFQKIQVRLIRELEKKFNGKHVVFIAQAMCCADGDHCCPERYTCDDHNWSTLGRVMIPWYTKTEALASPAHHRGVQCDPQTSCATGSMCWVLHRGCCPLDKVCCGDRKHCCPRGYTCDPLTGSCSKSRELRWDDWGALFRKRRRLIRL
ncbi:hypothetical protein SKAU_G00342450 [Synaphobranchus kaupii]|uniref:Small ribosomal subunit protein eS7 n=1 Tax=Synaphobranchus kaupii TaxID=118154 RepID=A0A9Q1IJN7_SYNKA|nr:hypothetical protein SKAU_G00342450 [Synaphobranchus kaupii]